MGASKKERGGFKEGGLFTPLSPFSEYTSDA